MPSSIKLLLFQTPAVQFDKVVIGAEVWPEFGRKKKKCDHIPRNF